MPITPHRFVPPLLCFALFGVAGVLVHAARGKPPEPPRDMAALVERLRPLGLHAVSANANGDPASGVYLCAAPRGRYALMALKHNAEYVGEWSGVMLVARTHRTVEDEGEDERAGPFLLFGDPALVRRVLEAMADGEPNRFSRRPLCGRGCRSGVAGGCQ